MGGAIVDVDPEAWIRERRASLETIPGLLAELREEGCDTFGLGGFHFTKLLLLIIKSGQPPEVHGTSVEELETLPKHMYKRKLQMEFENLRFNIIHKKPEYRMKDRIRELAVESIQARLLNQGLTPEDIGTSDEELAGILNMP